MVLAVSISDTSDRVKEYAKKFGLTYTQLIDGGVGVMGRYTDGIIPRTIVLDKEQKIVEMELGYTEKKFKRIIGAVEFSLYGKAREIVADDAVVEDTTLGYAVKKTETVESEGNVGFFTSIDLNKNEYPMASYMNIAMGKLMAARWDGMNLPIAIFI